MSLAVATTASKDQLASNTVAATAPASIADGDLLIACVAKSVSSTAPSTVPSGWTLVVGNTWTGDQTNAVTCSGAMASAGWAGIYWKIAASESGTYTWGVASGTPAWNVQILRVTGYRGIKPSAVFTPSTAFVDASLNSRATSTISQANTPQWCSFNSENVLIIDQFAHAVAATTITFSALTGSLTQVANSSQAAVTQLVAYEIVDLTKDPGGVLRNRQVTTSSASGTAAGYQLCIADPIAVDGSNRHVDGRYVNGGPSRSRMVN